MDANAPTDAIDEIVEDVRRGYPGLEASGLPITGRVLRLALFVASNREVVLAQYGLTVADFDVLASLRRRAATGAIKVRDLQSWMMLSSGGMTKRLDRLESMGLLERHPDPADRRGVLIQLTKRGRGVIDRALPAITESETELVTGAIGSVESRRGLEDGLRQLLLAQEAARR
jgi:DNA-binding MarR family transcriptional regulator